MLQVDPLLRIRVRGILSNLSSLISPLTHVYQRHDPHGYLGNQTGSVGGQGFQVLLLSSLCFPLVALQEQTQQQQRLITRWRHRLKWPCGPRWLKGMRFFGSHGAIAWPRQSTLNDKKKNKQTKIHIRCIHWAVIKSRGFNHLHDVAALQAFTPSKQSRVKCMCAVKWKRRFEI